MFLISLVAWLEIIHFTLSTDLDIPSMDLEIPRTNTSSVGMPTMKDAGPFWRRSMEGDGLAYLSNNGCFPVGELVFS
ncbi:hypothetical protein L211DRAFT_408222 [Terfezia boudieri ATCC MYA-4762]|uniref:Uncharacterized protein n=1 Tax=Terfezia boudieri ATCC MYA-4762 TaxID=1051890 RepID=A0A3N4LGI0_9PEZI|nr:hypothetical protein L211DRAFT_408222 [Terfezia boudieri ATCC MYA-4762]